MKKYIIDETTKNNLTAIINSGVYSIRHGEVANILNALIRAEEYNESLVEEFEEELAKKDEKIYELRSQIEAYARMDLEEKK